MVLQKHLGFAFKTSADVNTAPQTVNMKISSHQNHAHLLISTHVTWYMYMYKTTCTSMNGGKQYTQGDKNSFYRAPHDQVHL